MVEHVVAELSLNKFPQTVIRPAESRDLVGMEWDGEYRHFRTLYANAYSRMLQGKSIIWIAETDLYGLIGQVFIQLVCDRPELADGWQRAYLYSFRIKPDFRGHGLGTQMVKTVEDYLLERKFSRLTLNVAKDNPDALRLYKRLNFQIVAEEPGIWSYPDDNGIWHTVKEPSWRMEKLLIPEI